MARGFQVTVSGPLFDGQAEAAARDFTAAVVEATAKQGTAIIRSKAARFNKSGRGGHGVAAAAVTSRVTEMTAVITGTSRRGEVWWPWLEGQSKRNESTRFKGYHTFRLAAGVMRKRIKATAAKLLPEFTARMGGV